MVETLSTVSGPVVPRNQGASVPIRREASSAPTVPLPRPEQSAEAVNQQLERAEARRLDAVRQAAQQQVREAFPLRDESFTIYKDATTGQFITRFTNLRDGQVTYVPEPQILSSQPQSRQTVDPSLSLQV